MCIIILWFLVIIKTTESDSLSGKRKLTVHFMLSFFLFKEEDRIAKRELSLLKDKMTQRDTSPVRGISLNLQKQHNAEHYLPIYRNKQKVVDKTLTPSSWSNPKDYPKMDYATKV